MNPGAVRGLAMIYQDGKYGLKDNRPEEHRPKKEQSETRVIWHNYNWFLLTIVVIGWMIVTIHDRGWFGAKVYALWFVNCFATLPILLLSISMVSKAVRYAYQNLSRRSILPLALLVCALMMMTTMPTRAARTLNNNQSIFEPIVLNADKYGNYAGYDDWRQLRRLLSQVPDISDWQIEQTGSYVIGEPIVCLTIRMGSTVGLVHTSTGNLKDCNWWGWTWVRRINEQWFETSYGSSLWFLQPKFALMNAEKFLSALAGAIGSMGY
jgi:uncharacterized membrane protein YhdT